MKPFQFPSEVLATPDSYSTRVNGADVPYCMTLPQMDAYIRRHMPVGKRARVGLPTFDGLMAALIIDPTPSAPIDVVRVLMAASPHPDPHDHPDYLNFCGAIFARYTHITRSLLASPVPATTGDVFDVADRLRQFPDAFKPLLSIAPGMPNEPVHWALGFHNAVDQRPDVWRALTADHPHYSTLGHVYYFVPNTKGYPTNKAIRNHSRQNQEYYATTGIPADVITAWHHFRRRTSLTDHCPLH